eukprot:TRINITY_DN7027_c0_g1_i9.p1 TRINITY_DN7027_c0_g1~~TRINITY_DN7027_c0_g1_i9.p1  ORF type:complete len:343 (+),score=24.23 TRINITY_DN7027_c0_g1_i9:116-1144(+)
MYVAWCNEWCYKQGIAEGLHQTIWQMCRDVGFLMIRFRTAARYLTWQRNHYQSQPHLLITCGRYMEPILQGLMDEASGCDPLEIVILSEYGQYVDNFRSASEWTTGKKYHITVMQKHFLDPLKALLLSYSEKYHSATSLEAVKKRTQGETSSSSQNPLSRGTARHTQGETLSSSQILSSSPRTAARHTQGTILSSSQVPSSSPGMAPTQTVASSSSQSFSSSPETAPHTQGTTSSSLQIPSSSPGTASSRRTWTSTQLRNTTADNLAQHVHNHTTDPPGLNTNFDAPAYLQYHQEFASQGLIIVGAGKFDLCMYLMKAIQDRYFASRLAALLTAAMPDVYTD